MWINREIVGQTRMQLTALLVLVPVLILRFSLCILDKVDSNCGGAGVTNPYF